MSDIFVFPPTHDPGGKVKLSVSSQIQSTAKFSSCGRYRQLLTRCWDAKLPEVLFIGMNPSVADLTVDDPTVRKECGFAQRAGFGTLLKCNVMDYRATRPATLLADGVNPQTPDNLKIIQEMIQRADAVVCVWGRLHPRLQHYATSVISLLCEHNITSFSLGVNIDGSPKHPLYLANNTRFRRFDLGTVNAS